jgi:hypothetical protein
MSVRYLMLLAAFVIAIRVLFVPVAQTEGVLNADGLTALMEAVKSGADLGAKDNQGITALNYADGVFDCDSENPEAARRLHELSER